MLAKTYFFLAFFLPFFFAAFFFAFFLAMIISPIAVRVGLLRRPNKKFELTFDNTA